MKIAVQLEPASGATAEVAYKWDPDTEILSAQLSPVVAGEGMSGSVGLEGADGSFVVLDVADGALRGLDVVTWPDDIRTVDTLAPPAEVKDGTVIFPSRGSQPGVAAVEVDTALTMEKNPKESVLHLRVGRARTATPVRVGDHLLVEIDKQSRLAGIWLLEVPPFPNVEVTA